MTLRLTSSSFAGTCRKLVAVGTSSDASMLATIRAPAPRIGSLLSLLSLLSPGVAGAASAFAPCAASDGVSSLAELRQFAQRVGFPLILKPRDGAGASGTYRVTRDDELEHAAHESGLFHGHSGSHLWRNDAISVG